MSEFLRDPGVISIWLLIVFYAAARILQMKVIESINRKIPPRQQLSAWSGQGWHRMAREYRRLYPEGKLYQWALACAAGTLAAAMAVAYFSIRGTGF